MRTQLPWFTAGNVTASAAITVRQLLQHTSGLSDRRYNRALGADTSLEERCGICVRPGPPPPWVLQPELCSPGAARRNCQRAVTSGGWNCPVEPHPGAPPACHKDGLTIAL